MQVSCIQVYSSTDMWLFFLTLDFKISLSPTFGGSNPGFRAEIVHSVKKHLNLMCGCSFIAHPSAFASISVSTEELPFVSTLLM